MFGKYKYIKFEYGDFVVFPPVINHNDMARMANRTGDVGAAVSAGFVDTQDGGELHCFGESISIGIKSKPEDSEEINMKLS